MFLFIKFDNNTNDLNQNFWKTKKMTFLVISLDFFGHQLGQVPYLPVPPPSSVWYHRLCLLTCFTYLYASLLQSISKCRFDIDLHVSTIIMIWSLETSDVLDIFLQDQVEFNANLNINYIVIKNIKQTNERDSTGERKTGSPSHASLTSLAK